MTLDPTGSQWESATSNTLFGCIVFQRIGLCERIVRFVARLSSTLLNMRPPDAEPLSLSTPHFTMMLLKNWEKHMAGQGLPPLSHGDSAAQTAFHLPRLSTTAAASGTVNIQVQALVSAPWLVNIQVQALVSAPWLVNIQVQALVSAPRLVNIQV